MKLFLGLLNAGVAGLNLWAIAVLHAGVLNYVVLAVGIAMALFYLLWAVFD